MSIKATKFHPILFSTPMVQAILEGSKTQTRRAIKPTPIENKSYHFEKLEKHGSKAYGMIPNRGVEIDNISTFPYNGIWLCPYQVGDVLWVREGFYTASNWDHWKPSSFKSVNVEVFYTADIRNHEIMQPLHRGKRRPSIFMPKEACRIFLKVKSIRIERLQDISEEDAIAEGVEKIADYGSTGYRLYTEPEASYSDIDAVYSFESLWQSINGIDSWNNNPYVFVYEFDKIKKPLEFI